MISTLAASASSYQPSLVNSSSSGSSSSSSGSGLYQRGGNFLFQRTLPDDWTAYISSFFSRQELGLIARLNKFHNSLIYDKSQPSSPLTEMICRQVATSDGLIIPETLQADVNYKQLLLHLFPNAYAQKFVQDHYGYKEPLPPIPENFIKKSVCLDSFGKPGELIKDNFQLFFSPDYIEIPLDANTPLKLSEETEGMRAANKKPRLIVDEAKLGLEPSGIMIRFKIPRTSNNLIRLAVECFPDIAKQCHPPKFLGLAAYSWSAVLDQNGDFASSPHWSYQRREAIGLGQPYHTNEWDEGQEESAVRNKLKIENLEDRLMFYFNRYFDLGEIPQVRIIERTSTATRDSSGPLWQSTIWWRLEKLSVPLFRLRLNDDAYAATDIIGAAVGVPAES